MTAPELDPVTSASGAGPGRPDGYADLRSYAPIGDTRTVALVALDGRIDWWPIPDLDSCPTFAAILDAPQRRPARAGPGRAGPHHAALPARARTSWRRRTSPRPARCASSTRSTPAAPGRLPWTELARRVEGVAGRVPMRFAVAPGTCLNSASPWAHDTVHGTVLRVHDVTLAVRLLGEVETEVDRPGRARRRSAPSRAHATWSA